MLVQVLLVVLIFAALGLILRGAWYLMRAGSQRGWISAAANIGESEVVQNGQVIAYEVLPRFYPRVRYIYEVDGRLIESGKVSIDNRSLWVGSEEEARKILSDIESIGLCYYNPRRPSDSVLIRGLSRSRKHHFLAMIAAGIILLVLVAFLG